MAIKIVRKTSGELPAQAVALALGKTNTPLLASPPLTPQTVNKEPPKATLEGVQQPQAQSILQALKIWAMGDRKKVLMLVNQETGASWKVLDFEASTGRTRLEGTNGMRISPIPKERENDLYYPLWR